MNNITPVILCGGSGTRLWPFSRKAYPKQLLSLSSGLSMLQETMLRLKSLQGLSEPIVICNEAHRFVVAEQLLEIDIEHPKIILEPFAKNTAPAVAIAALESDGDTKLLVLPADHKIHHPDKFCEAVLRAQEAVDMGYLITFGVQPERPETGYGYIKASDQIKDGCYKVAEFVEKPNQQKAQEYVDSKKYYWNSGMFMLKASEYLNELDKCTPGIVDTCRQALESGGRDKDFIRLDSKIFETCKNESIDYAVMERSEKVAVIPVHDCGWSDLGSWDTVYDSNVKDDNQNVIRGDVYTEDVTNCYLHAEDRLLAVLGVKDHIVVETADAVLVAHKSASQDVKKIVSSLQAKNRSEAEHHKRVHRPWGYYEVLDNAERFQVKRIFVKPGASLSLQMHNFRSEHWVVIKGTAEVTCGDDVFTLDENQSTYIPVKYKHRLRNPTTEPLILIEVQTGSYLGEDDIVRFEDRYGRGVAAVS